MTIRSLINFGETARLSLGINIHKDQQGIWCAYCLTRQSKTGVAIVRSADTLTVQELQASIVDLLRSGCPVHLNITGADVLIREGKGGRPLEAQVAEQFPFLKADTVFGQQYTSGSAQFLSVIRIDALSTLAAPALADNLCSLVLGPFVIQRVLTLLRSQEILLPGHTVLTSQGHIVSIREEALSPEEVEGEFGTLSPHVLLAYAAARQPESEAPEWKSTALPVLALGRERFRFRRQLFAVSRGTLLTILLVLFVTTGARLWLEDKIKETHASLVMVKGVTSKSKEFETGRARLQQTYAAIGWEKNIMPLYYADQVALSMPQGLKLSELIIGTPRGNSTRLNKQQEFNKEEIIVKGEAVSSVALQAWLKALEAMPWVAEITNQRYVYNASERNGQFELKILTRQGHDE
jgi:hypothetical protein